ncbi:MAG: SPFH domain-containing protein [Lachnospiraceae bacterium]|jgi:regulator of protease activity HflC (stomatin/prohibitin superfamily)|nr:SPFH domain-containing protein [Lachnospiraceae bacterium]
MSQIKEKNEGKRQLHEEKSIKAIPGLGLPILLVILAVASLGCVFVGIVILPKVIGGIIIVISVLVFAVMIILLRGVKVIKPNEGRVFTFFGRYIGTLRTDGTFWVNPFATVVEGPVVVEAQTEKRRAAENAFDGKLSLKALTLSTDQLKINDVNGNPVIISTIVIWRVHDTAKAIFDVDNYVAFLKAQCDLALRNIVRQYPYDAPDDNMGNEKTLRGSTLEIAEALKSEIQDNVKLAGLEILEARITYLAYAPEIAAAMLQRQQASAIVDARQLIVDGAVGMVEMALKKLSEENIIELDEERKAAMVSNLMVVLCANKDAQPIVNSGSIY